MVLNFKLKTLSTLFKNILLKLLYMIIYQANPVDWSHSYTESKQSINKPNIFIT